jgi:UDPglucose 6-dehydrogenase
MKVTVFGTDYVGLVLAACLADSGNDVLCAGDDAVSIARLHKGDVPLMEPGLPAVVGRNLEAGRLAFIVDRATAVRASQVLFVTIPPLHRDDPTDVLQLYGLATDIGRSMNECKVVAITSAVPVGTSARVRRAIEAETDFDVHLCSNPQLLNRGRAVDDFTQAERIILGTDSERAIQVLGDLYAPFLHAGCRVLTTDHASAEVMERALPQPNRASAAPLNVLAYPQTEPHHNERVDL